MHTSSSSRPLIASLLALCGSAACGGPDGPSATLAAPQPPAAMALEGAAACDFAGTWAIHFVVPVSWHGGKGIRGGSGDIVQMVRSERTVEGDEVVDRLQVCGARVPDNRSLIGQETYGIRFPDALFDADVLPRTTVRSRLSGRQPGASYVSERSSIALGVRMPDAAHDPWPPTLKQLEGVYDPDGDGYPGITLVADEGPGYTAPPTGLARRNSHRARKFFLAVRNVALSHGTVDSCDRFSGVAEIPSIAGRLALNSHVLGCLRADGVECDSRSTHLLDSVQPAYELAAEGRAVMQRLPAGSGCAEVRALVP